MAITSETSDPNQPAFSPLFCLQHLEVCWGCPLAPFPLSSSHVHTPPTAQSRSNPHPTRAPDVPIGKKKKPQERRNKSEGLKRQRRLGKVEEEVVVEEEVEVNRGGGRVKMKR
jgi:hypothetical protein